MKRKAGTDQLQIKKGTVNSPRKPEERLRTKKQTLPIEDELGTNWILLLFFLDSAEAFLKFGKF